MRHEPIHASSMGNFADAIEPDDVHIYDICPRCGDLKSPDHELCIECAAKQRADEQSAKADARDIPIRDMWHQYYQERMERDGWTTLDVRRDCIRRRIERGDPPRPHFWSEKSILPH